MIRTYHIKHRKKKDLKPLLGKALEVANHAVKNKSDYPSSKSVKDIELPSVIKNQILRKYGRGNIKKVSNISLIVPNLKRKYKDVIYETIEYSNGLVYIKPLKLSFRWDPGIKFKEIKLVEINEYKFMITATFNKEEDKEEDKEKDKEKNKEKNKEEDIFKGYLGIDLNCGVGRHIANCGNLENSDSLNLGKSGPNIRKKYKIKRGKQKIKGNKEQRIMKNLDHQISRKIVNYALKNKLKIILEDLKNIRNKSKKGTGSKEKNRVINSWSFYRLQFFIEYKAKEYDIPVIKIKPNYTSQECSYCSVIGKRDKEKFVCNNKKCKSYKKIRNSDINASFNIAKRGKMMFN